MSAALKWKSKLILAEAEVTYGVDPTPSQAILAKNVTCKPMEGQDVTRDIERPFRGAQEAFPVGLMVVLELDVELVGGGTAGVAPPISPLLRACGLAEVIDEDTSVEYSPVSSGEESAAVYFWIGGNKQVVLGCRGTAVLNIAAQTIPTLHITLTGLWSKPVPAALPSTDFSAFKTPLVSTNVNTPVATIDGVSFVTKSFSLDSANDVQPRMLIGREEILIVDSNEKMSIDVEAVPLATFDPFDKAHTLASVAVAVQQDTRAGYKVAVAAPTCTVHRLSGYENDQGVLMWPLEIAPLPSDAGNDQFTITLT